MTWKPNEKLRAAILKRLGVLLGTKRPAQILAFMVRKASVNHPTLDLERDYSVIEDLAMQAIIKKYRDHKLDLLWLNYNFGYFQEDTETLLKSKLGDGYEDFIRNLSDDSEFVNLCRSNVLRA